MAEVSIIVPVYNVESYLAMCLDSIINQTYTDIEIICVNDGSTDKSLNILEHYKSLDDRIIILNKENGGLSSARNAGMKVANGNYIMFVDSDDWISSVAVEHLYNNAKKYNSDIVIFDFVSEDFRTKNKLVMTLLEYKGKYDNKPFCLEDMDPFSYKYIPVNTWSKFYKADLIKDKVKFYEDMVYEDVPFWAYVYSHSKLNSYLSEPFYFYRSNRQGAITSDKGRIVFDVIKAYERVEAILKDAGLWKTLKPVIRLLMSMDFLQKFNFIKPELREELFNAMKSMNKTIDMSSYNFDTLSPVEKACLRRFDLLNNSDYKTFLDAPFEVIYE